MDPITIFAKMEKNMFETPLFDAAKKGLFEEVKKFCKIHIGNEEKEHELYPALYIASYQGFNKIVEYLLFIGANPNYSFKNCLPPLHAAAQKGRIQVGKLLLDYGAKIDSKFQSKERIAGNSKETTFFSWPLLTAARGGHEYMVKFLLDHGANIEAKLSPNFNFDIKVDSAIERLFTFADYSESEIHPESEKIGYTALHLAVESGERQVVRILIDYGANIDSKSDLNVPPLFVAIVKDEESIIRLLKNSGANLLETVNEVSLYQFLVLRKRKKNYLKSRKHHSDSESEEREYSSSEW